MSSLLSGTSSLLPILSWSFLPPLFTRALLTLLYNYSILSRPTTQRTAFIHAQSARALVIISYLLYSFHRSIVGAPVNYYQILGLPLEVDGDDVKRSFRALARRFHPDKVGPEGEAYFILLRKAHDALQDSGKRFAYDRFGPDVTEWRDCVTLREYMLRGIEGCIGFYVINPLVYTVVTYLGGHNIGSHFWRLATMLFLLSIELHLLISPTMPRLVSVLLPNSTQHDIISLLRELFTISLLAAQQLAPVITALELGPLLTEESQEMELLEQMTHQLDQLATHTVIESMKGVASELRPFQPAEKSGAATLQQAAAAAATGSRRPAEAAQQQQQPTNVEATWTHLFTREMMRRKLLALVPAHDVTRDRQAPKANESGAVVEQDGQVEEEKRKDKQEDASVKVDEKGEEEVRGKPDGGKTANEDAATEAERRTQIASAS
ncbi:hypothetical protein ACQY0O_007393 [Thecaphora frezii]